MSLLRGIALVSIATGVAVAIVAFVSSLQEVPHTCAVLPQAEFSAEPQELPELIEEGQFAPAETYLLLLSGNRATQEAALAQIEKHWHEGSAMMLVECMRFAGYPTSHGIAEILQRKMGWEALGDRDVDEWYQLLWQKEYTPHPQYAGFKGLLYGGLDPRFVEHFEPKSEATIRLDEIRWGGVRRDGIPPLDRPEMIPADEATYLEESNIVFGVEINGDARAYPKRILAWHEMFKDTVGGVSINGVYCTLCGSMIIYETELNGAHHELGTSGFLYRSNKLMYDKQTNSLWNQFPERIRTIVRKTIT